MNNLCSRAIKRVNIVIAVGKGAHAAATAGAGEFVKGGPLWRKSLAIVCRARHPNPPIPLAFRSGRRRVPEHIDIANVVGGDGPAPIQTPSGVDQIALWLELGPSIVQPRKQHGMLHPRLSGFGAINLVSAVPGDI